MSDKENISALIDGESVDKALIVELEHEKDAQQTWRNYHLIGDVMRGDAPASPNWDIAASVAEALENEPAYSNVTPGSVQPIYEAQPSPVEAKKALPAWLQQLGQVAVAACVSFTVILGVQQYGGSVDGNPSANEQIPVLQTVPMAGSVEPVSLTREAMQSKVNAQQNDALHSERIAEQRRRINSILQDYELQLRLSQSQNN